jgi:Rrf2 family protein
MVELAGRFEKGPVQLKSVAQSQQISVKYLEQLFARLRSGGLVLSKRGSKGGYLLAKSPENIKLSEIFLCLEGPVVTVDCIGHAEMCERAADCVTRTIWQDIEHAIMGVLESRTLKDLVVMDKPVKADSYQI